MKKLLMTFFLIVLMFLVYTDIYAHRNLVWGGIASSDSTASGIATADSAFSHIGFVWTSGDTLFPHWVMYDFIDSIRYQVEELRVYSKGGDSTLRFFNFYGGNSKTSMTILLENQAYTDTAQWQIYRFNNDTAYQYYKLETVKYTDSDTIHIVKINGIEMYERFPGVEQTVDYRQLTNITKLHRWNWDSDDKNNKNDNDTIRVASTGTDSVNADSSFVYEAFSNTGIIFNISGDVLDSLSVGMRIIAKSGYIDFSRTDTSVTSSITTAVDTLIVYAGGDHVWQPSNFPAVEHVYFKFEAMWDSMGVHPDTIFAKVRGDIKRDRY